MGSSKKNYEAVEHPSDIGIEFYGKDLKELFENAAKGMFWLMTGDFETTAKKKERKLVIEEKGVSDNEGFLISWLERLLYDFDVENLIYTEIRIEELSIKDKKAYIKAVGHVTDELSNKIDIGIKAPTYHQLEIKKTRKGFKGKVIFDV